MGNRQSRQSKRVSKQFVKDNSSTSTDEYPPSPTDLSSRYLYVFPVDESESIRNEKQQTIAKIAWQGNFSSPIGDQLKGGGLKILDIGYAYIESSSYNNNDFYQSLTHNHFRCGPGTWVSEMAETYPLCSFTGVDISPVYPLKELPENVEFIQANILDGLPIESRKFDFVVMHFLNGCFTMQQWKSIIIQEVVRVMKPGAWLEWMECNASLKNQGENTKKLVQAFLSALNSQGLNPWIVNKIPKILDHSGIFVNRQNGKRTVTYGSAAGKCGELSIDTSMNIFQAIRKQIMEFMSITPHEYDLLLDKVREEIEQYQTTMDYYRFCAQIIVVDND
ncbi:8617_t:CDS:2 [Ambispora gerdemannii]|uniref:8617_t:CDS:1 n=1 Tax=Ambispora gerdemannii TaxID=144530 RepID=A0A9N9CT96_9GLOM|nr:8617_t:CDS:2 [Ambispora gerdemannii]